MGRAARSARIGGEGMMIFKWWRSRKTGPGLDGGLEAQISILAAEIRVLKEENAALRGIVFGVPGAGVPPQVKAKAAAVAATVAEEMRSRRPVTWAAWRRQMEARLQRQRGEVRVGHGTSAGGEAGQQQRKRD